MKRCLCLLLCIGVVVVISSAYAQEVVNRTTAMDQSKLPTLPMPPAAVAVTKQCEEETKKHIAKRSFFGSKKNVQQIFQECMQRSGVGTVITPVGQ